MDPSFFGPEAWLPFALALRAYRRGAHDALLLVHSDVGPPDPMPVAVFFRTAEELRAVDEEAVRRSRGKVLDVGAGAGAMALLLQDEGLDVTALEVVPEAVEAMRESGVRRIVEGRLEDLPPRAVYDTVLFLMNGVTLAGTLAGLPRLLTAVDRVLAPGGRVFMDSTDLRAREGGLPERGADEEDAGAELEAVGEGAVAGAGAVGEGMVAELEYQLEFRGERGAPFPQLFLDAGSLLRIAAGEGWNGRVVARGEGAEEGEYLVELWRSADFP
jgi:SAM-dependent methyltransferase